jgi:deoxyribonuclease V
MKLCLDVQYFDDQARVAALSFQDWSDSAPAQEWVELMPTPSEYQPGEFYRRELPCLLKLLQKLPQADTIVIDGYVWLGPGRPGLGGHLHEALGGGVVIIGVAKTFYETSGEAVPVCRGGSQKPLFVTAAGMDKQEAAELVQQMHGYFRMPTLLKSVDQLARGIR